MKIGKCKSKNPYACDRSFFWDRKIRTFFISFWKLTFYVQFHQKDEVIPCMYVASYTHKEQSKNTALKIPYRKCSWCEATDYRVWNEKTDCAHCKGTGIISSDYFVSRENQLLKIVNTSLVGPVRYGAIELAKSRGEILHGWTGKKCPTCFGHGEINNVGFAICSACGGIGDEYGELTVK